MKVQRMRANLEKIEISYLPDLFREIRSGQRDISEKYTRSKSKVKRKYIRLFTKRGVGWPIEYVLCKNLTHILLCVYLEIIYEKLYRGNEIMKKSIHKCFAFLPVWNSLPLFGIF